MKEMKIRYEKPASRFGEALPLGNGQIGAMVYGGRSSERITLTENTFFSGKKASNPYQEGASKAFKKMREAAEKGRYDEVHRNAESFIGQRESYGTHLPTGELRIDFVTKENKTSEKEYYEQGLDIRSGFAWIKRLCQGLDIVEEIRVSHPDKVLMVNLSGGKPFEFRLWFEPYHRNGTCENAEEGIYFTADAWEEIHCDEQTGVHLEGAIRIKTDGNVEYSQGEVKVTKALWAEVYVAMDTDYGYEVEEPDRKRLWKYLHQTVKLRVKDAAKKGSAKVILCHEKDMKKLTDGMTLNIDGTDRITEKIPFLFQYGRYLLFSSSREDSKLPTQLQGIWNDDVACRIGWTCDMHLDINTQMNYWPAEFSGLTECTKPLFGWIRDVLAPEGRKTAKAAYGYPGWVGEIVSNAWGYAAPYWASPIAPCPTGGVWILTHMWEHYLYTKDKVFLEKEAFPLIKEAVLFFKEYVYKKKSDNTGEYVYTCGPSISPENSFLYEGKTYQISSGCTYEILMIRELFSIYLEAVQTLGEEDDFYRKIEEIRDHLLPYRVLENGCIAEWDHELVEADPQHRHTSHLLGLYPFSQITPEKEPALCEAAKKTIERKLVPEDNWEDTGWARSMLMLYEARLQDGEKAYKHICQMIERLLEPNQMIYHPPTRGAGAFDHVYELDGNTGLSTCIGEMLIQSHNGIIRLLPALPREWKNGQVRKFHARGNIELDVEWADNELRKVVLRNYEAGKVTLCWKDKYCILQIEKETTTVLTPEDFE